MLSFLKKLFKGKPKKEFHCAQCGYLIHDNQHVFVFNSKVVHNYVNCVWGYLNANKMSVRNRHSVLLKKIKKTLP